MGSYNPDFAQRLNLYMDKEKVKRVDAYAAELGISRSAALSIIVTQFFEQRDSIAASQNMLAFLQTPDGESLLKHLKKNSGSGE